MLPPIAEGFDRSSEQRSIIANGAEQKAHFGVSLLNKSRPRTGDEVGELLARSLNLVIRSIPALGQRDWFLFAGIKAFDATRTAGLRDLGDTDEAFLGARPV